MVDKKFIYNILMAKYMELFNLEYDFGVFPEMFFPDDIDIKTEVLVEALNKKVRVDETDKFLQYIEKVDFENTK